MVAMYLAREYTTHSLPAIGRLFGGRDHTTVMHACARVEAWKQKKGALPRNIGILERKFAASAQGIDEQRLKDRDWIILLTSKAPRQNAEMLSVEC
jgi:hypothetical protein